MIAILYILFIVIIFIWLRRRTKESKVSKGKAIGLYAAYTTIPLIMYGVLFFILVGIEDLLDTAIVGEGYARSLPLVTAGGLIVAILAIAIFSVVLLFFKKGKENTT